MTTAKNPYGIPLETWDKAVDEIQAILIERAKKSYEDSVITYGDLARLIRTVKVDPPYHALADMLGDATTKNAKRGILMSALVYNEQEGIPGNGFYRLAADLGYKISDGDTYEKKAEFATEHQKAVIEYWGSTPTMTVN